MAPWALALVVFAGALGSDAERSMGDVLSDVMEDLGIESEHHGLGRDVKAAAEVVGIEMTTLRETLSQLSLEVLGEEMRLGRAADAEAAEAAAAWSRRNATTPARDDCSFGPTAAPQPGCDEARAARPFVDRCAADVDACERALCAYGDVKDLALRYATFRDELLVVTPHKAGSRYVTDTFASIYNCTLKKHWYGEVRSCGEARGDPEVGDMEKYETVVVVRDPVDRVLASYNHVAAPGTLQAFCRGDHPYTTRLRPPPSLDERLRKFAAFLGCIASVRDLGKVRRGIEWRHVQPFARYAFAATAPSVARVEALGDVVRKLAARLPVLGAAVASGAAEGLAPWLSDAEREDAAPVHWIRGSAESSWALRRCEVLASNASLVNAIRRLYDADWTCFGAVLPSLETDVDLGPYTRDWDAGKDHLRSSDVPEGLRVPEVFPTCADERRLRGSF